MCYTVNHDISINCHLIELHPHIVAEVLYNGAIENEIRQLVCEGQISASRMILTESFLWKY